MSNIFEIEEKEVELNPWRDDHRKAVLRHPDPRVVKIYQERLARSTEITSNSPEAAMLAKCCVALGIKINEVISSSTAIGNGDLLLPRNKLVEGKVLEGVSILEVANNDLTNQELLDMGADAALIMPGERLQAEQEISEKLRLQTRQTMADIIQHLTKKRIYDLIMIDRGSLYSRLTSRQDSEFGFQDNSLKELSSGLNPNHYRQDRNIGYFEANSNTSTIQIFQPKFNKK